jgi:hypothetical protein
MVQLAGQNTTSARLGSLQILIVTVVVIYKHVADGGGRDGEERRTSSILVVWLIHVFRMVASNAERTHD